jgi:hypothetical protein
MPDSVGDAKFWNGEGPTHQYRPLAISRSYGTVPAQRCEVLQVLCRKVCRAVSGHLVSVLPGVPAA